MPRMTSMHTLPQLAPGSRRVAVIGAGPAGLMAAEVLAAQGAAVDVYDAMPSAGRKFLLAGRGGMNITHSEPLRLLQAGKGIREDLQAMLRASVRMYSGKSTVPGLPTGKGCMVVISAINCAPENSEHSDALSQRRHKRRNEIRARLLQAQREGEIRADADVTALGDFYTSFLNGLALGARDGVSTARLAATLPHAMLPLENVMVHALPPE